MHGKPSQTTGADNGGRNYAGRPGNAFSFIAAGFSGVTFVGSDSL